MDENITRIEYEGKEILLIATAHVSQKSVELVKQVIEEEHPDSVCIELDEDRYNSIKNPKKWEETDIVQVIKEKKAGYLLANLALSAYQKRIAKQLDTQVGGEMLQGMKSAEETGAELVLADRKIQTTFMRIWRKLNFWEKSKLLSSLLFSMDEEEQQITDQDLEELLKADMLESVLVDMRKEFPKIGDILISERDQHLANKIREAKGPKIVAVLGGAHVKGVSEEIFKEQDMEQITTLPPKNPITKVITWGIPILVLCLIIYAFAVNIQTGLQQLTSWVIWNSILAGVFALIAGGHPLSVITAAVAAPFTSLNPLLACGWFAGLVQATIKKPMVQDVLNVHEDIFHIKGFYKNRFLKALLVVIMANIGSSIGTFVAGTDMIRNLF
ncbi:TraB/GumN family protein [Lachnospiraceae bacterium OttesenSCG-928-D06]|nr:TraB/GumN family protein [Lachnospiraceae bacterium OttesenSCG-928-D06]